MKSAVFSIAFALVITTVSAGLECVINCASAVKDSPCSGTDASCMCTNPVFIAAVKPCFDKCTPDEQKQARAFCPPSQAAIAVVATTSVSVSTTYQSTTVPLTTVPAVGPTTIASQGPTSTTPAPASSTTAPGDPNNPACFGTCVYSVILNTAPCFPTDYQCMCKGGADFVSRLKMCYPSNCVKVNEHDIVNSILGACTPTISTSKYISTTSTHPVGYNTTIIATTIPAGNSTKANTVYTPTTKFSNTTLIATSTTVSTSSSGTGTSSTGSSTRTTSTSTSADSGPTAPPSSAGAARMLGSGFVAAVVAVAFFAL